MKHRLVIEYDLINNSVEIVKNDMTTFEAFGVIEAAKAMITERWLKVTEEQ
ncbi:hypothetical protein [Paenibacillus riograndensis]|uniref:hypothetical protein n=1 Tax=Paenibacillus riograndensis TaxID=483937 RepID=UPI000AA49DE4|nr:hypothetical protein [Paenibacillus riograndensis]